MVILRSDVKSVCPDCRVDKWAQMPFCIQYCLLIENDSLYPRASTGSKDGAPSGSKPEKQLTAQQLKKQENNKKNHEERKLKEALDLTGQLAEQRKVAHRAANKRYRAKKSSLSQSFTGIPSN